MSWESKIEYKYHYPKPGRGQDLFACDWVDDREVPLGADHNQNENGSRVAQRVYELVHFAQEVAEHPTAKKITYKYNQMNSKETYFLI